MTTHLCQHCGASFVAPPRLSSGPSRKRFCSQKCRLAWHSHRRTHAIQMLRELEAASTGPSPSTNKETKS